MPAILSLVSFTFEPDDFVVNCNTFPIHIYIDIDEDTISRGVVAIK